MRWTVKPEEGKDFLEIRGRSNSFSQNAAWLVVMLEKIWRPMWPLSQLESCSCAAIRAML